MKKDILKIAGVKSEAEFYKKFPSEAAFMKVHGKAFKKAKMGASMVKKQLTQLTDFSNPPQAQMGSYTGGESTGYENINFGKTFSDIDSQIGVGSQMEEMQDKLDYLKQQDQRQSATPTQQGGAGGMDMEKVAQVAKIAGMFAGVPPMKRGGNIPKYQNGPTGAPLTSTAPSYMQFGPQLTTLDPITGNVTSNATGKVTQGQTQMLDDQFYAQQQGAQQPAQPAQQQQQSLATTAGGRLLDKGVNALGPIGKPIGQVVNAGRQIKQSIDQAAQARQASGLSKLALQASSTRPEETKRRYNRPEDMQFDPNQLSPSYGTGYDVMQATAEYGAMIGGNPTEIQNMYNPGDIYSDMGYEPLSESDVVKQYRRGGQLRMAEGGLNIPTNPMFNQIGNAASIAGDVGSGLIDMGTEKRMKQNQQILGQTAFQSAMQGVQNQNSAFMEDGGWVSHDWQPQVITQFGDYNMKDLLKDDPTMDTLRAGGNLKNYTDPSARAMSTERPMTQMGGELQTHWGGGAEPISYNPYLPDGGETVMFRGQSHDESDGQGRTGIGITFGNNPVEVERGEPAVKLQDGGEEESLVVYGNMKIPSYGVSELGDPKAKNKKFKSYANDLSKMEAKQNRIVEKGLKLIDSVDENSPFDLLKMNAGQAMIMGGNEKLKGLAIQKQRLAGIQNAILDTAEEYKLESDALAKGQIKKAKASDMAKFGGKFTQAQDGTQISDDALVEMYNKAEKQKRGKAVSDFQRAFHAKYPEVAKQILSEYDVTNLGKAKGLGKSQLESNVDEIFGKRTKSYRAALDSVGRKPMLEKPVRLERGLPDMGIPTKLPVKESPVITAQQSRPDWRDAWREFQPYLIPSNQEPFDASQISPEIMALATNQLEPVQAQSFRPLLETPYTVSYQDVLNANQADYNALQRQVGYNPAALSELFAKKYSANAAVKAQEFRENQGLAMGAYNRNRGILNDASLKNLAIYDQQFQRQSQAKSATKAQAQAALSSIADKIAKNKLENKTLGVYENMYNYRFGPKGRAYNVNAPVDWNMQGSPFARTTGGKGQLSPGYEFTYDATGNIIGTRKSSKEDSTGKNGTIVKAIKNL